jgi:hypothetical protein
VADLSQAGSMVQPFAGFACYQFAPVGYCFSLLESDDEKQTVLAHQHTGTPLKITLVHFSAIMAHDCARAAYPVCQLG